ncbi:MAG: patatin-like phospholipase family protein [Pseudomonadota bacterium]
MTNDASRPWRTLRRVLPLTLVLLGACTTVLVRAPVQEAEIRDAKPYGIERGFLRTWGDFVDEDELREILTERITFLRSRRGEGNVLDNAEWESLALSGGGPDGAFGAGVLAGWTARGDRPTFEAVTGVSTGAIIALYAFLGPEYDDDLREIYAGDFETDDLVVPTIFAGLTGGTSLLDASGYRALIEQYVDDDVVRELAVAHDQGRVLLVGTTNIDASRPVVWNLTNIAATGHPQAKRLIHDVIQASSAIPAAFPPVLIPVETATGQQRDEMHVDGGATQQVMLFSPQFSIRSFDQLAGRDLDRSIYVIVNNKLTKSYDPTRPRLFSIAARAASSLIGGSGGGDLYRLFAIAQRDGMDMNVLAIPRDFNAEAEELFDPVYMRELYELGYEIGLQGGSWLPHPPDFRPYDASDAAAVR